MFDINAFRDQIIDMHGLSGADGVYTFYHDETNNTRKLRINAQGFNVAELNVFVLGGIVHDGAPRELDMGQLRRAMHIQASAREIKLTHVAKGSFLEVLRAEKLTTLLRWIAESGLTIHYRSLDPLYWSIVDIIDSILARLRNPMLVPHHELLKSDLMLILRANLQVTIDLFHRYKYPSLDAADRRPFLEELLALLDRHGALLPEFNARVLKGTLQVARQLHDLVFIENNEPHELIENFSMFYLTRIALFKNSGHIFDMEESVKEYLRSVSLMSNGQPVANYRFADSKEETGIQLSDVVVGVVGKMFSYLANTLPGDVAATRAQLSGTSLTNAELLRDLVDLSDEHNRAFLEPIISIRDRDKLDRFLRFKDGAYA